MRRAALTFAALLLAPPAFAQTPSATHPGEEAVDPYVVSDANAGGRPMTDDAVFQAFGGRDGVAAVVKDLIARSEADPRIADIFKGGDMARLQRTLTEQVCFLLAGPCSYTGRTMDEAHRDMGLRQADFNVLVEHLQAAMTEQGVPFRAQNRLLAKLAPMHRDVVDR